MSRHASERGISVVEVLIGVALFALIVVFVSHAVSLFLASAERSQHTVRALYLAQEGQEVLRFLRDDNWSDITDLSTDTMYYFDLGPTAVATTTVTELVDGRYTRSFILREVYRDSDDDVVASTTAGASVDAGSRRAVVRVEWGGERVQLETILTNIFNI